MCLSINKCTGEDKRFCILYSSIQSAAEHARVWCLRGRHLPTASTLRKGGGGGGDEASDFNLVKNQSRGHANVAQLPSVSMRTKADRKRSD